MGSGDVFQLLLYGTAFLPPEQKIFFFGFFELSKTRFYICQFYGMGSADLDIKVIDLQDLLFAHNLITTVYKLGMHAKGVFGGRTNVEL